VPPDGGSNCAGRARSRPIHCGHAPADFLYEQLAAELGDAIERGALRAGARLPSVRRLAEDRALSVATVVAAYDRLEGAGLVEARPKSGYFVRRHADGGDAPAAAAQVGDRDPPGGCPTASPAC
jgi:DNA-binding transcriptional MocR family regulator